MSRAICFRCDWDGETRAAVCPRCGTPLHRVEATDKGAVARSTPKEPVGPPAPDEPVSEPGPRAGARRVFLGLAAVALVVGVAVSWLPEREGARPLPLQAGPKAGVVIEPHGTLVYAAEGPGRGMQLWKVNLGFGEVVAGPRVPSVRGLVDASSVGVRWLGLTVPRSDGSVEVAVLEGTTPRDRPRVLGAGDLAAWGSHGESVAVADVGSSGDGCHRVRIDVHLLETGATDRVLDEPSLCADLTSLGRAGSATYFTLSSPDGGASISYTGVSAVSHLVLDGYAMVSISPNADLLVTEDLGAGTSGTTPDGATSDATVLFWRGRGGPVPFGTTGAPLVVRQVLAWAPDGAFAMVLGRLGPDEGLFQIVAEPGPEYVPREPVFVRSAGLGLGATYASDGTAFFVQNGNLYEWLDGGSVEITLPRWAPPPAGPIVWVP